MYGWETTMDFDAFDSMFLVWRFFLNQHVDKAPHRNKPT
jgi:hypothetical protein